MFYGVIYRAKIGKRRYKINRILFNRLDLFMNFLYGKNHGENKKLREGVTFRKFNNKMEAEEWLSNNNAMVLKRLTAIKKNTIYFDAGTGRGIGTETRITNEYGNSLCGYYEHVNKLVLTEHKNFLFTDKTNNYGELAGLYIALKIAMEKDIKVVAGDSELVLVYWSAGRYKENKLPEETVKLIKATIKLRIKFEEQGGEVCYINGNLNPADLGFHKKRYKK